MVADNEVAVWSVHLDAPDGQGLPHWELLSTDERQRAERFHFERDRARFVARRAALRSVLGGLMGVPGDRLLFVYGAQGKPSLAPQFSSGRLSFNTSHSDGLAVIAVARDLPLGVDVERLKPLEDLETIASRFFCAGEIRALNRVAPEHRPQAFFNCWTRKEAFLKAGGEGLTRALDSFEVSLIPGEPARLLAWSEAPPGPGCTLCAFDPAPGFVGAVAAQGATWTLRVRPWRFPV